MQYIFNRFLNYLLAALSCTIDNITPVRAAKKISFSQVTITLSHGRRTAERYHLLYTKCVFLESRERESESVRHVS